jgi:hypothetical protein
MSRIAIREDSGTGERGSEFVIPACRSLAHPRIGIWKWLRALDNVRTNPIGAAPRAFSIAILFLSNYKRELGTDSNKLNKEHIRSWQRDFCASRDMRRVMVLTDKRILSIHHGPRSNWHYGTWIETCVRLYGCSCRVKPIRPAISQILK